MQKSEEWELWQKDTVFFFIVTQYIFMFLSQFLKVGFNGG